MKKIGILTQYYKSINFGGNLQAYALCKVLNKNGYQAEQICHPIANIAKTKKRGIFERVRKRGIVKTGLIFAKIILRKPLQIVKNKLIKREIKKHDFIDRRAKAFEYFNTQVIPHSENVYTCDNINECTSDYDVFITGSDQVWNMNWYRPEWFLEFVHGKPKIAYAASLASDKITEKQSTVIKEHLKDFTAVSIREKKLVERVKELSPVGAEYVLDPTLLLSDEEWNEVCADRVISEKYVFCYFLGVNKNSRKIAEQFAKERGLILVNIPHAGGTAKLVDRKFGDEKLYDTSPEQFLSLIKNAEYVFTDSFHAVVFSNIYKKQYFVFNRSKKGEMSSRIVDITNLFNSTERFCVTKECENIKYINKLQDVDYTIENKEFDVLKDKSIKFLTENIR